MKLPLTTASHRHCACGREFECGADTDTGVDDCWCAKLPMVLPIPTDRQTTCLCPDCLTTYIDANNSRGNTINLEVPRTVRQPTPE
ncbi:MAG: cysteine-rich CWC family protein [Burkholderiales bacterium]|nr:cysteine-rich CWC family protein [Phycisphaerae bacterium]